MNRTSNSPALVLNIKPSGENNASVTLLTKNEGIVYATLYGGPKSKMRSLVSQWNSGIIYLYENHEKNQLKISDFDVKKYHTTFGQSLFKMYAASLAAELAIKTRCGGSNQQCFDLVNGFIDGLDLVNEEQGRLGMVRFLWRFLELLGIQPETETCGSCEKTFYQINKFAPDKENYYNVVENKFICNDCEFGSNDSGTSQAPLFPIKNSAVNYLSAISNLSASQVRQLTIDKESYEQIRNIVFFLIENNIESKLNTIETGMGIL